MSTKSVKTLKPLEGRKKVVLLYNLCNLAKIDIEEELATILSLVSNKIGKTGKNFTTTGSQVLDLYKIGEPIPYSMLGHEGQVLATPYELSEEEINHMNECAYVVKEGHSLIGDIEEIIDELSEYAPKKDHDRFVQIKLGIAAKASEKAKTVIPTTKKSTAKLPTEAYANASFERTTNAPAPSTKSKSMPTPPTKSASCPAPPKPNPQKVPKPPKMDPIQQAVSLSETKGLPVYFNQVISGKKIKKGIYYRCTIDIHGEHKVSKNAIFIDCKLA